MPRGPRPRNSSPRMKTASATPASNRHPRANGFAVCRWRREPPGPRKARPDDRLREPRRMSGPAAAAGPSPFETAASRPPQGDGDKVHALHGWRWFQAGSRNFVPQSDLPDGRACKNPVNRCAQKYFCFPAIRSSVWSPPFRTDKGRIAIVTDVARNAVDGLVPWDERRRRGRRSRVVLARPC